MSEAGGHPPPYPDAPPAGGWPPPDPRYGYGVPVHGRPAPSNTWAVLAHVGAIIGCGFVAPLVAYLCSKDNDFSRRHGAEGLNFHITCFLAQVVVAMIMIGAALTGGEHLGDEVVPTVVFIAAAVTLMAIGFAQLVLLIVALVKAARGEDYRFPLTIRLVKP